MIATDYQMTLPPAGAGLWPITTTMVFYLMALIWVYVSIKSARQTARDDTRWTILLATYFAVFASLVMPVLIYNIVSVVDGVIMAGIVINFLFGLLLMREAYRLESQLPPISSRPLQGVERYFFPVVAVALLITVWLSTNQQLGYLSWGLLLAVFVALLFVWRRKTAVMLPPGGPNLFYYMAVPGIIIVYFLIGQQVVNTGLVVLGILLLIAFIPRRDFASIRTSHQRRNLLPRTLEALIPSALVVALPAMTVVSPALGLVLLVIPAIKYLVPPAAGGSIVPVTTTLPEQVTFLYQSHALGLAIALAMNLIAVAVVVLVMRLSAAWAGRHGK
jgi:hypothetical protein